MKIFKCISDKFKKNYDIEENTSNNFSIEKEDFDTPDNTKTYTATGSCCYAAGINSKITPSGFCTHPEKREVDRRFLDGLPISERHWTHCVFYRIDSDDGKYKCFFGGDCEYCKKHEDENKTEDQ